MVIKKVSALTIPLLVLIGLAAAVAGFESRRGPEWKIELDQYLTDRAGSAEIFEVERVVPARKPGKFSRAFGAAIRDDWQWQIDSLPLPPQAVQCVLLRQSGPAVGAKRRVVYVGFHTDTLWRVGWLVHEGPESPFSQQLTGQLETIGCDLSLE
ncbi:MAG: hypothetical protein R3264_07795 [Anaerolineae bacterium]|nr:hypothetical protein [Anaerolineae bacterium]